MRDLSLWARKGTGEWWGWECSWGHRDSSFTEHVLYTGLSSRLSFASFLLSLSLPLPSAETGDAEGTGKSLGGTGSGAFTSPAQRVTGGPDVLSAGAEGTGEPRSFQTVDVIAFKLCEIPWVGESQDKESRDHRKPNSN